MDRLKAPFPAFGGKARIAAEVWARIGDVSNAIEPFCNSMAWLLARPSEPKIETANDMDFYISNFWRAVQHDPEAVAAFADGPVSEPDLHARHRWLVGVEWPAPASIPARFDRHPLLREAYLAGHRGTYSTYAGAFRERMRRDPDYFDAKIAGWWVNGACQWIGSGWCSTGAEWEQMPFLGQGSHAGNEQGRGVHAQALPAKRPLLAGAHNEHGERTHQGLGVHAKGPSEKLPLLAGHLGTGGAAIHDDRSHRIWSDQHRPQLADAYGPGRGVHSTGPKPSAEWEQIPLLGAGHSAGKGVHLQDLRQSTDSTLGTCAARRAWLCEWFGRLRDRLRTVRVCCGDFLRVCQSESVTTRLGLTGIYFDPPYPKHKADGSVSRSKDLYATDSGGKSPEQIRDELLAYCLERGDNTMLRIAISGYSGDGYEVLEQRGWSVVAWSAAGGYANRNANGNSNRDRERIWFNPSCLDPEASRLPLFDRIGVEV